MAQWVRPFKCGHRKSFQTASKPNGKRLVFAWQSLDELDFEFFDQYLLADDSDFCFVALGDDVLYRKIEVLTPNRIKFWIFTYKRVTSTSEQARAMRILFE